MADVGQVPCGGGEHGRLLAVAEVLRWLRVYDSTPGFKRELCESGFWHVVESSRVLSGAWYGSR